MLYKHILLFLLLCSFGIILTLQDQKLFNPDFAYAQENPLLLAPRAGEVIQGNAPYEIILSGAQAEKVAFRATLSDSWQDLRILASEEGDTALLKVKLPRYNSNTAQLQVTLKDGGILFSDLFTIDSVPPESRVVGIPYLTEGKIKIPFFAQGPDLQSLHLALRSQNGQTWESSSLSPTQAIQEGFSISVQDGLYDLTLLAQDQVGNVETKIKPDLENFLVDTTPPKLGLEVEMSENYAKGGQRVKVRYHADDSYIDSQTLTFEYLSNGNTVGYVDPGQDKTHGEFDWELPREDYEDVRLRFSARDLSGNLSTLESKSFALFGQSPHAVIVGERAGGGDQVIFKIDYVHSEALKVANPDFSLHIYEGTWNEEAGRFVWDTENPIRDAAFVDADRSEIRLAVDRQDKAYCARLYFGPENNLNEEEPHASTEPESIFIGLDRLQRVTLVDLPLENRIVRSSQALELQYTVSEFVPRNAQLILEYSNNGGRNWKAITEEPIAVSHGLNTYSWKIPEADLAYGVLRAVTEISKSGVIYRVQDLMEGGIVVDDLPPLEAKIIRVIDENKRPLKPGQYTNSKELSFEWRALDDGASGISHAHFWHASSQESEQTELQWSNLHPGATEPDRLLPSAGIYRFQPEREPQALRRFAFDLQVFDYAGNSNFENDKPAIDQVPKWNFFVDYQAPEVSLHSYLPVADKLKVGDIVTLSWEASDDTVDSLGSSPVSIYMRNHEGEINLLETGLSPYGVSAIEVPATASSSLQFFVVARDQSGNQSSFSAEGIATPVYQLSRSVVPEVSLALEAQTDFDENLSFSWQANRIPVEDLDQLLLWRSDDGGKTWQLEEVYSVAEGLLIYETPSKDGRYAFSLTGLSKKGLEEAAPLYPRDIEASLFIDRESPEIETKLTPDKGRFLIGGETPNLRLRVSDPSFQKEGVTITLKIEQKEETKTHSLSSLGLENETWAEVAIPAEEPGNYQIMIEARDRFGNASTTEVSYQLLSPLNHKVLGFSEDAPYYTRSQRMLFWNLPQLPSKDEEFLTLSFQRLEKGQGEWQPAGPLQKFADHVPDTGRFYLETGLPEKEGFYRIALEVEGDPLQGATYSKVFYVEKPELKAKIGNPEDLKVRGIREYPLDIVVTHKERLYELPPQKLAFFYRFYPPGSETPLYPDWEEQEVSLSYWESLLEESNEVELGTYKSNFLPFMGEGRYEIIPFFQDIYGFKTFEPNQDSEPDRILTFDAGAPQVELHYKTPELLFFKAYDPFLDASSLVFEARLKEVEEDWKPVYLEPDLEQSADTVAGFYNLETFANAEDHEFRVRIWDAVGNLGYAQATSNYYPGGVDYRALQATETEGSQESYTGPNLSRRADFQIVTASKNLWPEGLQSITLYWRKVTPMNLAPRWQHQVLPLRFVDKTQITLPFHATSSGLYQFIVASRSRDDRVEFEGEPKLDTKPELEVFVYTKGYILDVAPLYRAPENIDYTHGLEIVERVDPGQTYRLQWSLLSDGPVAETTKFFLSLSTDGGRTWGIEEEIIPTETQELEGSYFNPHGSEMIDELFLQNRFFSYDWQCPSEAGLSDDALGVLRIRSVEISQGLPELERKGLSPHFFIGTLYSQVEVQTGIDYYTEKIKDAKKSLELEDYEEALRHLSDARQELDTSDVNELLADVYEKLGDQIRAKHHRDHAKALDQ